MQESKSIMDNSPKNWKVVIGLGNPGKKYEHTYHNAGKMAVRVFAENCPFGKPFAVFKNKPFSYTENKGVIFVLPAVYMNESGISAAFALKHFKIAPEDLLVVHDDSDIKLGDFKLSYGGTSAGHKGVESVIEQLKTPAFSRLRIGIRGEKRQGIKAMDFVLDEIPKDEMDVFCDTFNRLKGIYFK